MILDKIRDVSQNRVFKTLFRFILVLFILALLIPLGAKVVDGWMRKKYGLPAGIQLGQVDVGGYYLDEVEDLLVKEADEMLRWPEPAQMDSEGGISTEIWGEVLDLDATMLKVATAQAGERVEPVLVTVYPKLLVREILNLKRVLGVYGTEVGGTDERAANVRLASKFINYTLLMPGEIFSFNQLVGAPTAARGFQEAPIIVGDQLVPGYGGGICQVSSTLYNAVLRANLEIIERHTHSQEVHYVPPGKDATVAYDYLDFKFENSTPGPILIRFHMSGRWLQAILYGPTV